MGMRTRNATRLHSKMAMAAVIATAALVSSAQAQSSALPGTWSFSPDMGYGYASDGRMLTYKMGTDNAKLLLKGAKKVPRNTLFFVGENGQLYMRSGPFLEGGGKFMFGPG